MCIRDSHYVTTALFRDTSAWYHIVLAVNTDDSTASDRIKIYVNGSRITDFATSTSPSSGATAQVNNTVQHEIGNSSTNTYLSGHLSQTYFIDGQQLDASYFGYTDPLTNTWRPKKYDIGAENNSNNGTTWDSTNTTAYDGGVQTDTVSGTSKLTGVNGNFTSTLSSSVIVRKSLRLQMYASIASFDTYCDIQVNGSGEQTVTVHESQGNQAGIYDLNFTGTLSSIKVTAKGGANIGLAQVIVDDYVLINGAGDNTFYLPMDGNSVISQDQSGKENDWTPVNFGGSAALDKATGALPILNTDGGGNVARIGTRTDPYAANLVLALPLVGSSSDVSNSVNSGSTTKVTASTNAVASSASSNFYGGSWYFDGSGDYLDVTESNNDFDFGTGDFTIELFVNLAGNCDIIGTANNSVYLGSSKSGWVARLYSDGIRLGYQSNNSWIFETTFDNNFPLNKWNHLVFARSGTDLRCFLNGIQQGSTSTNSTNIVSTEGYCRIGGGYGSTGLLANGYMSDVRVYKGIAKYTSNFVVPSTSPDILPDTPSGVSGSSKLAKIIEGAVAFDGTDDYLSFYDHSDWDIGTGAFTVECFVNINSASVDYSGIFGMHTGSIQFQFRINAQGRIQFLQDFGGTRGNTDDSSTSGTNLRGTGWHHVALTRQSDNSWQLYVDGRVNYSGTGMTGNITNINEVAIGRRADSNSHYLNGFISNLRFINGTALYTTDFTPPTAPLTNVTNTKLLCCQSNATSGAASVSPNISGINDGTVWSDNTDPALDNFDGIHAIFDGSLTTRGGDTNTAYLTYVNNVSISASTGIRIYWNGVGAGQRYIRINGSTELNDGSAQLTPGWSSVSSFSGTINKIEIKTANTGSFAVSAIEIDGTILIDPVTALSLIHI